jgi:hypothetical protein
MTDDQHLEMRLGTTATRLARTGVERAAAVAELREIAAGRADLLALAAGRALGGFLARPGDAFPGDLHAPALLLEAGADPALVPGHADETRRNALGTHHTTATTGGPPNGGFRP